MVISRVLSPQKGCAVIHLRMPVARHLKQPTRRPRAGHPQAPSYLALLQVGFTKHLLSPTGLVSSYLTLSPLPSSRKAVSFLWHFPWGRPRSVLRTTLPYGARTFLWSLGNTVHDQRPQTISITCIIPDYRIVNLAEEDRAGHIHI